MTINVEGRELNLMPGGARATDPFEHFTRAGYPLLRAYVRTGSAKGFRCAYAVNLHGFEGAWYWTAKSAIAAYKASAGSL